MSDYFKESLKEILLTSVITLAIMLPIAAIVQLIM